MRKFKGSLNSFDRRTSFAGNNSITRAPYGQTEQVISITDIISEGPIGGLVNGGKSIYLNNDNIFDDEEVSYRSTGGQSVSNSAGNLSSLKINLGFTDYFNYQVRPEDDAYILVNNVYNIPNVSATSVTTDGWTKVSIDWSQSSGSSTTLPSSISNSSLNLVDPEDGKALVVLASLAAARSYMGLIDNINNTNKTADVYIQHLSNIEPFNTSVLYRLSISQWYKISSASSTTLTLTTPTPVPLERRSFSITGPQLSTIARKYENSGFQFVPGTKDQPLLITAQGVGSSTTSLPNTNVANLERGVPSTITVDASYNPTEIDKVQLVFNYPGGLYFSNTEKGNKKAAGAGYKIRLRVNDGVAWKDWINLKGNQTVTSGVAQDLNTQSTVVAVGDSIFSHGGKFLSAVSFTHTISLLPYQPYTQFQIEITRVTNSADFEDNQSSRAHVWADGERENLRWRGTDVDKWQAVQGGGVSQVLGIITEKLNYPFTALANVTFSAKQFSDVPSRTYDCYGLLVKVPDNYTTREEAGPTESGGYKDVNDLYSGIWTGDFRAQKVYTDNPAWVFYDIITNNRYGVGDFVRDSDIDKYALYKIARYCDELVPDGRGGLEPRFRANVYLQKATDVYKVLKDMATIFRGMLYWSDGKLFPVIDEKKSPVYLFNRSNVINGAFSYENTGSQTRTNQVIVRWNNPDSEFKLEPLILEDRENIVKTGRIISEDATAFGCTSPGQAIRYGRWKLWTAINQTEIVSFKTAINAAFLAPGDIINIQDNHDFNLAYSGRISSATTTTVTVDRAISGGADSGTLAILLPIDRVVLSQDSAVIGGVSYTSGDEIRIAKNETGISFSTLAATDIATQQNILNAYDDAGNIVLLQHNKETIVKEVDISNISGNIITLGTALTTQERDAAVGQVWGIRDNIESAASYKQYKILSLSKEDNDYSIVAVEYFEGKFDVIDYNFSLSTDDPLYPNEDVSSIPYPNNFRVIHTPNYALPGEEISLSWTAPDYSDISYYELTHNVPGYENPINVVQSTGFSFEGLEDGIYNFSLRTVNSRGRKSKATYTSIDIEDVLLDTENRLFGVIQGGYTTSKIFVDGTNLKFEANPVVLVPKIGGTGNITEFLNPTVDFSSLSAAQTAYVLADLSASTLRLVDYVQNDLAGVGYWQDVSQSASAQWTSISFGALVYFDATTSKITSSTGSNFLTEVSPGDIIRLTGGTGVLTYSEYEARVTYVESNSVLYLDRTFYPDLQNIDTVSEAFVSSVSIDYSKDFLAGTISGDGTWKTYLTLDPDLQSGRAVVLNLTSSVLNYDSSGSQVSPPTSISAEVLAIGYTDPEFSITIPAPFSEAGTTSYSSGNIEDIRVKTYLIDSDGLVSYSAGAALTVSVTVREKNNPSNTAKTVTSTLSRIRQGATGQDGRTVSLTTTQQAFAYDESGNIIGTPTSTITASSFNTALTPYYEFLVSGSSVQNLTSNTYSYTPESLYSNMPEVITVRLREGASDSAVVATDIISMFGLQQGATGSAGAAAYSIILSNEAHTLNTTVEGVVNYLDSGTTLRVFEGATELNSVSGTPGQGEFSVSVSATNISVGAVDISGNAAIFADHSSMTAVQATIEYTVNVENTLTITKVQSLSKSIEGQTGAEGDPGLRTIQGYLYYEKSVSPSTPPSNPAGTTYTFSTGLVSGTDISTGVGTWTNAPRTQDPTSDNIHYALRYYGTETTASSASIEVTYSGSAIQAANFTGVVSFTDLSTSSTTTVIHGANISTGVITLDSGGLGHIKAGKATWSSTAAGFFLGFDPEDSNSSAALFSIGDSTQNLSWNGSSLQITGNITADTLNVVDATIQGELTATTLSDGSVKLSSLSQEVLNLIDSRIGTTVGATYTGYFVRNNSADTYNGTNNQAFELNRDAFNNLVSSATRGPGDITVKLTAAHWIGTPTDYTALSGSAHYEYRTDPSGTWTSIGTSIQYTITKTFINIYEPTYVYYFAISDTQVLTGLTEGTAYDWRIVWNGAGASSPLSVSPALFEASVVEGASGVTSTGGTADNATTLDGLDSTQFLRSDTNDTFTGGTLTINNNLIVSGSSSMSSLTLSGYLRGPAIFTIDPAAHGDDTGTVVIAGNLQIDGTTTTVNSTTLEVEDKNIVLAKSAANAAAADGGGITLNGAGATITYSSTGNRWNMNRALSVSGGLTVTGLAGQASETTALMINGSNVVGTRDLGSNAFNSTAYLPIAGGTVTGNLTASTFTLTGLAEQATEATALMINGSNVVGTRELGSNAFNSTAYLPLTGGTLTGNLSLTNTLTLNKDAGGIATISSPAPAGGNDAQFIRFAETVVNSGYIWIAVSDDFDVASAGDVFYIGDSNLSDYRFKLQGDGNAYLTTGSSATLTDHRIYADNYHPVADAWTTGRTLTIGDTGKTVSGSANVSWTTTEIGITKTNIDALNIDAETIASLSAAQFLRSDTSDTFTSGTITFNADTELNGTQASNTANPAILSRFLANPASENGAQEDIRIINDLAGLNKWGSYTLTNVMTSQGGSTEQTTITDAAFDGTSSNWFIYQNAAGDPCVIELVLDNNQLNFSCWVGIVFGNTSWRAKSVKIETFRNGAWQTECDLTNQASHIVSRQVTGNDGNGVQRIRYTLDDFQNTASGYVRIHSLYALNYQSGNNPRGGVHYIDKYKDTDVWANHTWLDNYAAKFGSSGDLSIFHDGSNSRISDSGTGSLIVSADNFYIRDAAGSQSKIDALTNGAVTLYYSGSSRIATTASGATISGILAADELIADGLTLNLADGGAINVSTPTGSILEAAYITFNNRATFGYNGSRIEISDKNRSGDSTHTDKNLEINLGNAVRAIYASNGDVSFYEDTGTTAKFFWDSSTERLGIGTTTPVYTLDVGGVINTSELYRIDGQAVVNYDGTTATYGTGKAGDDIRFTTSAITAARISASGAFNLISATQGFQFNGVNILNQSADGNYTRIYAPGGSTAIYLGDVGDIRNYYDNNAHRFRLKSGSSDLGEWNTTGLGVGTITPTNELTVAGGSYASNQNVGMDIIVGSQAGSHWKAGITLRSDATGVPYTAITKATNNTGAQADAIQFLNGNIRFFPASVETMRIDSAGNVGIGTDSPSTDLHILAGGVNGILLDQDTTNSAVSARLMLSGSGGATSGIMNVGGNLSFRRGMTLNSTSGDESISINGTTGNLGIGTNNPQAKLDLGSVSTSTVTAILARNSGGDSNFRLVTGTDSGSAINTSFFNVGIVYDAGTYTPNSMVKFYRGGGTTGGFMAFTTNNDTERMRIDGAGNVGIGTNNPQGTLHVRSVSNVGDAIVVIEADADNNVESDNPFLVLRQDAALIEGYISLTGGDNVQAAGVLDNSMLIQGKGNATNGHIQFATGGTASGSTNTDGTVRLSILSTGNIHANANVGIGTATPAYPLTIHDSLPRIELRDTDYSGSGFQLGYIEQSGGEFAIISRNGDNFGSIDFRGWNGTTTVSRLQISGTTGYVGIGTESPDKGLVVSGGTSAGEIVINNTESDPILRFRVNGSTDSVIYSNNGSLNFSTKSTAQAVSIASSDGTITAIGDLVLARGTVSKSTIDALYIGGTDWAGSDAAIYIGNEGDGTGYGWRFFYEGSGATDANRLIIKSENIGSPVNVLSFTQSGSSTFAGTVTVGGVVTGQRFVTGSNAVTSTTDILITDNGNIGATQSLNFIIDTDNNNTGNSFTWRKNGPGTASSEEILALEESGAITLYGGLNFTPDTGVILSFDGTTAIERHAGNVSKSMSIGCDDTVIIGAGEARATIVNNIAEGPEQLWLGAEGPMYFVTSPDNWASWATRNEMVYDSSGNLTVPGQLNAVTKSFLINHPTKEGMKLRYGSLEGPENGVYVRGTLKGSNVIELPEYWTGLVDETTITVQLTPNGRFQKLYVKEIKNNQVIIKNASWFSNNTECFYIVYGERKDVEKLVVEY